jgi:Spy/CpxP family protein refolding chaperone
MKKLLKLSLALVVMFVFATGAIAQTAERKSMSKDDRMKMKIEKMKSELSLTDEQAAKIQEIYKNHFSSMENKGQFQSADKSDAQKEEFKNKRAALDKDIKAVLTADQLSKYEAMKAERKAKMKERHGNKNRKNKGEERSKTIQGQEAKPVK